MEELHERAEKAWENSKLRKIWDEKISAFKNDFPLKKKVGLFFEVSRFKFEDRTAIFFYFTFPFITGAILALVNLDNSRLPFSVLILLIIVYAIIFLWTGGTFSRSYSEITDEKNKEKFKSLSRELASVKRDFIRTWKSSNKNPAKVLPRQLSILAQVSDMRQTMSKII